MFFNNKNNQDLQNLQIENFRKTNINIGYKIIIFIICISFYYLYNLI